MVACTRHAAGPGDVGLPGSVGPGGFEAGVEAAEPLDPLQLARDALERGDLAGEAHRLEVAAAVDQVDDAASEAVGARTGEELAELLGRAAAEGPGGALSVRAPAERAVA